MNSDAYSLIFCVQLNWIVSNEQMCRKEKNISLNLSATMFFSQFLSFVLLSIEKGSPNKLTGREVQSQLKCNLLTFS